MSYPNSFTFQRGTKDTADTISQEKPLEIGNKIWTHKPRLNKGLGWALRKGGTLPTPQHKFGHLEDSPYPNWVEYAGANESSQATTGIALKTGHGVRLTTGSRVYWTRTEEIMRLTAVMATDSTGAVDRNFGKGTSTDYLMTGDKGLLLPPNFEQGFTTGLGITNAKLFKSFATTIVDWPLQITDTENAEEARGGNPFTRALSKSIDSSKAQMEAELFFGAYKVDDSYSSGAAHPISASQGLHNWITTHAYSASKLSRMDLWDILLEWKLTNKDGGAIFCSGMFKNMVTNWSMAKMVMDQGSSTDGMAIDTVKTPAGTFDLVEIDLFDEDPYLAGMVFLVPGGKRIKYRPLIHNENLDVRYNPISRDEVHAKEGEVYGEYGWEFFDQDMFAKISGLQFAA